MSHEFNFAKFHRQPHDKELPRKDEIIGLASIAVSPTDPLEQSIPILILDLLEIPT